MQCEFVIEMKEGSLSRLKKILIKEEKTKEDGNKIECLIGNTKQHLNKSKRCETNQEL